MKKQQNPESDLWFIENAQRSRKSICTDFLPLDSWKLSDKPPYKCAKCGEGIGTLQWLPPFEVTCDAQAIGIADISHIDARELIVTDDVLSKLRKAKLTGVSIRGEVKITKGRPKKIVESDTHKRYLIETRPVDIRVDERESGYVRGQPVKCFYHSRSIAWFDRIVFERPFRIPVPDIFIPYNLHADTCVSDRFKRVCEEHGFTGIKFIHPLDLRPGYDFFPMGNELFVAHMHETPEQYLQREREMIAKHGESIFDPKDDEEEND